MENCAEIGSVVLKLLSASGSHKNICKTDRIRLTDSPWEFSKLSEVRFFRVHANSVHVHPNLNRKITVLAYLKLTELYS